jgi:glycosyltransferase involved in cell wall biosynthesis
MLKHVRAEVGLAPVKSCDFNASKSSIKWLEYSLIGIPTVASYAMPYSAVIENDANGFLCADTEDWVDAIRCCLDNKVMRRKFVSESRKKAVAEFNIKETAKLWKSVLKP